MTDDPIHSSRRALLLGEAPGPLPNWFERELRPTAKWPRCELEPWQIRLVDESRAIKAREAFAVVADREGEAA